MQTICHYILHSNKTCEHQTVKCGCQLLVCIPSPHINTGGNTNNNNLDIQVGMALGSWWKCMGLVGTGASLPRGCGITWSILAGPSELRTTPARKLPSSTEAPNTSAICTHTHTRARAHTHAHTHTHTHTNLISDCEITFKMGKGNVKHTRSQVGKA